MDVIESRNAPAGVQFGLPDRIVVRSASERDRQRWNGFVLNCPDATFFHLIEWRAILEEVFGHRTHYLIAERGGDVVGVLPLVEMRSVLFGHSLSSLPFAAYGGPAALDDTVAQSLVDAATALADAIDVEHVELRNQRPISGSWPRQDLYVTFRRAIEPDVEANMLAIPRKQRAMVRKGMRNGLRSELEESAERFFDLYADNMHRHGTPPFAKEYFERLQRTFGSRCEVLVVTDTSGTAVSGVLSFYFKDEVLPYYAGDTLAARDLAANDFKYWELMRRGCERGLRRFDFGRSKRGTGSFDFKKNWGFEPTPLHYEYRLRKRDAIPENNPLNPKYAALIATWRRLPRVVANTLGPRIVRNLG